MGLVLIGICLGGLVFFLVVKDALPDSSLGAVIFVALVVVGFALILAGVFLPTGGYEPEVEIKRVEIFDLERCIDRRGNPVYTFFEEDDGNNLRLDSVKDNGMVHVYVKELDVNSSTMAVYVQKAKVTFWSWAVGCSRTKIVFEVPAGTIKPID